MATKEKGMTVSEARAHLAQPFVKNLPSGLQVKLRRMTVYDYIQNGITEIPNEFYRFIAELNAGQVTDTEATRKNLELLERFIEVTLAHGVLEPQMMFKYDAAKKDTHLVYTELSAEDQHALISAITGR